MRLFRVLMYGVFGILAATCVLLVIGVVASFAFGGHSAVSAGADQHAELKAGAALHASTEAGVTGDVQIVSVQRDASTMTITAKVKGMAGAATLPNSWQVYLWGDTRAPMAAQQVSANADGVVVRASAEIPADSAPEFVQFSPDGSHGDLYFDVTK
jgi:hypothetical protein